MPRNVIFCALLVGTAMWGAMFCVPPMEPLIKEQMLLTHTQASLLFSGPVLMLVAIAIPAGFISDQLGFKKATGIGLIIMAIGAVLRGTADSYLELLAFTFIFGLGLGWTFPNLPKLVSTYVDKDKAHVTMGIVNSGFPIGTGLGLAITIPIVLPIAGTYQGVFFIWSIPIVLAAVLWWIIVKEPKKSPSYVEQPRAGITAFRSALLNKRLWSVAGLMFLHQFFMLTWTGWAPVLMMQKGASLRFAGLIASTAIWVGIPTFIMMPKLSHKMGVRKPFIWGPSIALALLSWGAISVNVSASWYLMALIGVATATRFTTILTLPIEIVREREVGVASGMILSIGYIGGVIGPLVGGLILDSTGNLNISLLILAGVSIAAVVVGISLPETGPKGSGGG